MADAAQEFLDKQLSKNKFTIKQQERLDASGGPAVVDASEGVIPGGGAYAKYGKEPGAANESAAAASTGTYEEGWRADKDSGAISWSDAWNEGANFQQLKGQGPVNSAFDEQFAGLTKSGSDVDDDGAWVTLNQQDGMGATADAKARAAKWQAAGYDVRVQDLEGAEGSVQADIAVRKGSGTAKEEKERTPIEHSPEVKQAIERVRSHEDGIMSGKTSEELFGDYYGDTGLDLNKGSEAPTNKGETGVGTQGGADYSTAQATYSFLDSKKAKVKEANNIQPKKYAWSAD